jgi:microcystin degradation protein MlrC
VPLRILIAGISHETNTYCSGTTPLGDFWILRGERIRRLGDTKTDVGGMLAACEAVGAEAVLGLVSGAQPSGTIAADAYASLKGEILAGLRDHGPVDAVALALHGAGVAEGVDDLEGDLCSAVRAVVGPHVPVGASFDLHGNVTQAMADVLDLAFGCHEYPHIDMADRGEELVRGLADLCAGRIEPVSHVETVPLLLPTTTTLFGPALEVNELCAKVEARDGILDCTFFHGFPYTDTRHVGAHVYVTADRDSGLARRTAQEVARALFERREDFRARSLTCEQAIARALAVDGGPVVIHETSDNPGGGAPGDGTHLLRAMVEAGLEESCFGFICDPEAAEAAHRAGVGATLEIAIGGKTDDLHGAPLPIHGYVKSLTDGRFVLQAMSAGVRVNLGPSARLRVGGIDVVVASGRQQTFDPEIFRLHGIDVERYKIVALKSSHHFRAGFQELAREIVGADPPGLTTHQIEVFPRKHAPGPLWPLEEPVY